MRTRRLTFLSSPSRLGRSGCRSVKIGERYLRGYWIHLRRTRFLLIQGYLKEKRRRSSDTSLQPIKASWVYIFSFKNSRSLATEQGSWLVTIWRLATSANFFFSPGFFSRHLLLFDTPQVVCLSARPILCLFRNHIQFWNHGVQFLCSMRAGCMKWDRIQFGENFPPLCIRHSPWGHNLGDASMRTHRLSCPSGLSHPFLCWASSWYEQDYDSTVEAEETMYLSSYYRLCILPLSSSFCTSRSTVAVVRHAWTHSVYTRNIIDLNGCCRHQKTPCYCRIQRPNACSSSD